MKIIKNPLFLGGTKNQVSSAYASDSLLIWTNRTWPEARGLTSEQCKRLSDDSKIGWQYAPIPCDNFLDVCNDLMCYGLELGLPIRGAVSMGIGVFDKEMNIFIGQPLIDTARLERAQTFIGAGFHPKFLDQTIPKRYFVQFNDHIKQGVENLYKGNNYVLDWPRHWRNSRKSDPKDIINLMNISLNHALYYETTLKLLEVSQKFTDQFESPDDVSIRSVYQQFSFSKKDLEFPAFAVREILVEK